MRSLSTSAFTLMLVLVVEQASADSISIIPIADTTGSMAYLSAPSLDAGNVAYRLFNAPGAGVYTYIDGTSNLVASPSTPIPGGTDPLGHIEAPSVDADGSVVFRSSQSAEAHSGIYTNVGGSLSIVAESGTAIPGGTGNFEGVSAPAIGNGSVAFRGTVGAGGIFQGVYTNVGGSLNLVADTNTAAPGGTGNFVGFDGLAIDDGNVAFRGRYVAGGISQGIYTDIGGSLNIVADANTPIPGGTGNFYSLNAPSLDDGSVAFINSSCCDPAAGVYSNFGGTLHVVADTHTAVPGGAGNFTGFVGDPSLDAGNVAFIGNEDIYTQAIYVAVNGVLLRVMGVGDMLDGKQISSLSMSPDALSGNQLAFRARYGDFSEGVYLATIPEPSTALLVGLGMATLAGAGRRHRTSA